MKETTPRRRRRLVWKPDLGFPLAPRRGEHGQAQIHASKEEAAPAGVAVGSGQSRREGFHPGYKIVSQYTENGDMKQVADL